MTAATQRTRTYPALGRVRYYPQAQKSIRISFQADAIRVSYPHRMPLKLAEAFVHKKTDWLIKHRPVATPLQDGMPIARHHRLSLQNDESPIRLHQHVVYGSLATEQSTQRTIRLIKKAVTIEAQTYLQPLIKAQIDRLQLHPQRVTIRHMSSQWGSCNKDRRISFNSLLVDETLSEELVNYVIVHELCHLRHLNHSTHFWQLVHKYVPNYLQLRQTLRSYRIHLAHLSRRPKVNKTNQATLFII